MGFILQKRQMSNISVAIQMNLHMLLSAQGNYLITDSRFTELAEQYCPGFEVVNWHNYDRSIPKALESICMKAGNQKTWICKNVSQHTISM